MNNRTAIFAACITGLIAILHAPQVYASDHLDSPAVITEPMGDIGDLYGWMSGDGRRLNLVMTIVGQAFSPQIDYSFHIDSGKTFGNTRRTIELSCRFKSARQVDCALGSMDRAIGDASLESGLVASNGKFRVFTGLRDDPFFNNVRGTRDMYTTAVAAINSGVSIDASGCPAFDPQTSGDLLERWTRTDGGPGRNFLAGRSVSAIIVSIDFGSVARGGKILAIWSQTRGPDGGIDRSARPLTGNALLATLGPVEVTNRLKEEYNRATPSTSANFATEIGKGLALYDGFDGQCGNQWLADKARAPVDRYESLSSLLVDDRLWINGRATRCSGLFGVERFVLSKEARFKDDCGGRGINADAVDIYRSLLVNGTLSGVNDGVRQDDQLHSADRFPYLAAPQVYTP